jgi:hypothetical protein
MHCVFSLPRSWRKQDPISPLPIAKFTGRYTALWLHVVWKSCDSTAAGAGGGEAEGRRLEAVHE